VSVDAFQPIVNGSLPRQCGVEDVFRLRRVHIGDGAAVEAADWICARGTERAFVLTDRRTLEVLGEAVITALKERGVECVSHVLLDPPDGSDPGCDDETIGDVTAIAAGADRLVAVGSGTVNDITKSAATALDVPWVCLPTAASMNGYTSAIAAVLSKGVKRTVTAHQTEAVFADVDVIGSAPQRLTRSGFGDLVSKPWSNACWTIAHHVTGAAKTDAPSKLLDGPFHALLKEAPGLSTGDPVAIGLLTETLLLSGCSMALAGSSSPASGGEHLISHYWDMVEHAGHRPVRALHGTQVGVATLISAALYERVVSVESIDVEACMAAHPGDGGARASEVRGRHPRLPADVVEELVEQSLLKHLDGSQQRARLEALQRMWPALRSELKEILLPRSLVRDALIAAGAPTRAADLGVDAETLQDTIRVCRDMRSRYTILDLAADLGLLAEFSRSIGTEEAR